MSKSYFFLALILFAFNEKCDYKNARDPRWFESGKALYCARQEGDPRGTGKAAVRVSSSQDVLTYAQVLPEIFTFRLTNGVSAARPAAELYVRPSNMSAYMFTPAKSVSYCGEEVKQFVIMYDAKADKWRIWNANDTDNLKACNGGDGQLSCSDSGAAAVPCPTPDEASRNTRLKVNSDGGALAYAQVLPVVRQVVRVVDIPQGTLDRPQRNLQLLAQRNSAYLVSPKTVLDLCGAPILRLAVIYDEGERNWKIWNANNPEDLKACTNGAGRQLSCADAETKSRVPCPVPDYDIPMMAGDSLRVTGYSVDAAGRYPFSLVMAVDGSGDLRLDGKQTNVPPLRTPVNIKAAGRSFWEVQADIAYQNWLLDEDKDVEWIITWEHFEPRKVYLSLDGQPARELNWRPNLYLDEVARTALGNLAPGKKDYYYEVTLTPGEDCYRAGSPISSTQFLVSRYYRALFLCPQTPDPDDCVCSGKGGQWVGGQAVPVYPCDLITVRTGVKRDPKDIAEPAPPYRRRRP